MTDGARSLTQRIRVPLGFLFGLAFLWFAPRYATPQKIAIGAAIAFVGVLIRAWATGHIVKNETLTTTGPYAHTRNPLYVGQPAQVEGVVTMVSDSTGMTELMLTVRAAGKVLAKGTAGVIVGR